MWSREASKPAELAQYFGMSNASKKVKQEFVERLEERQFGPTLVMICGETNIVRTKRDSGRIIDEFGVRRRLRDFGTELILNPVHTYMRRYEMEKKRRALAVSGRWLVSVWNAGMSPSEAALPWGAYYRGRDVSNKIEELDSPIPEQPGIRIGILKVE